MTSLPDEQIPLMCDAIEQAVGLPAFDLLRDGAGELVNLLTPYLKDHKKQRLWIREAHAQQR
jgi:hypothetical protein